MTFKEDCADLRNTRVVDIVKELRAANAQVDVHDPLADGAEAARELGLTLVDQPSMGVYDAVVLAVPHRKFRDIGPEGVRAFGKPGAVLFDVKSVLPAGAADGRL